jgi:hypothetical protein
MVEKARKDGQHEHPAGRRIESSVILLALGVMPILRGRSAALRHGVLTAALVCAAGAPLLGRVVPSWQLPDALMSLASAGPAAVATPAPPIKTASGRAQSGDATRASQADAFSVSALAVIRAVWIGGVFVGIAILVTGFAQLARLATRARQLREGAWTTRAESIGREFGLVRPVVMLLSAHPSLLVTWGILRPKVVLPSAAAHWPDDRVRIVLYHELAHVRRCDWLVLVAAEALKCIYWFNPLMWWRTPGFAAANGVRRRIDESRRRGSGVRQGSRGHRARPEAAAGLASRSRDRASLKP